MQVVRYLGNGLKCPSVYCDRYYNAAIEIVSGGNHLPTSLDKSKLLEYSNAAAIPFAGLGSNMEDILLADAFSGANWATVPESKWAITNTCDKISQDRERRWVN